MSDTCNPPSDIWRLPTVMAKTGYRRTAIYEQMRAGTFPMCHRLGPRAVGWSSEAVQAWIDAKLEGQK